jgi:hypothetical protein
MANDPEKLAPVDHAIESAIQELLRERGPGKAICPSEAARRVSPDNWQSLMENARAAAQRMASRKLIVVTQHGREVEPSRAKGAIRLKSKVDAGRNVAVHSSH